MHFTTNRTFIASVALTAGQRVKYIGDNQVGIAGVGEVEIGTVALQSGTDTVAQWAPANINLRLPATTVLAGGAFADGAVLRRLASGKVDDTGNGAPFAIALQAAGADGDMVDALPLFANPLAPTVVALGITNGDGSGAADLAALKVVVEALVDLNIALHAALVSHGIVSAS